MVRNTVKNAILDLYILLKNALKIQKIPFHSPKIQKFSGGAYPRYLLEFFPASPTAERTTVRCHHGNFNYVVPLGNDNSTPLG